MYRKDIQDLKQPKQSKTYRKTIKDLGISGLNIEF
jgi:hypothetical protein